MVTCPLVPDVPHLVSGSCSSPRAFGLGFLQTPPRDDALALLLAFGSAYTWREDLHLDSSVPCLAHTTGHHPRGYAASACMPWLGAYLAYICDIFLNHLLLDFLSLVSTCLHTRLNFQIRIQQHTFPQDLPMSWFLDLYRDVIGHWLSQHGGASS